MTLKSAPRVAYEFGSYRLEPSNACLSRAGEPVELTAKAFDTLVVLVERAGTLVSKEELLDRVWPDVAVDENNLTQQVSTLRRALAGEERLIETVPKRGYRFVARVLEVPLEAAANREAALRAAPSPASFWQRGWRSSAAPTAGLLTVLAVAGLSSQWELKPQAESRPSPVALSLAAMARGDNHQRAGNADGAVAELREAIRLDPTNANAYGMLAHALNQLGRGIVSSAVRPRGASPSVEAARRGVELAPQCASCLGTLALFTFYHDWQFEEAGRLFEQAIRLGPEKPGIRPSYAMWLAVTGRPDEAVEQVEIGLAADPYQPSWLSIRASSLYFARRYEEAIAAADRILAIRGNDRGGWDYRSKALFQLGRGEEALHALAQEMFAAHSRELDQAVRDGGINGGLRKLLELTDDWRSRIEFSWRRAAWRAQLGDAEGAMDELERAYESRRVNAPNFAVDPVFDRLRAHPRFRQLLTTIGLAPYFPPVHVAKAAR